MSEQTTQQPAAKATEAVDIERVSEPVESTQPSDSSAKTSVNRGVLVILLVIFLSLIWYLLADRFTPYTSQARVQGFVVGVAPKVAGVVTKVMVENNQEVKKNQPLFEIDQSDYKIALEKSESDLQNAQDQIGAGNAGIDSARANLRAAKASEQKARQEANRLERLYKEDPGTISVRRLEKARASLEQSRARVAGAEADVQRAIETVGGDDANNPVLKSARSAVQKARLDLANTVVRAESRGVITDLRVDVGHFAGTGKPVLTLLAIQNVWITADFTENNLGHLEVGDPVEIVLDTLPGQVFNGKVQSIGLGISASHSAPPGTLPSIQNDRDWLRQSQRFPVVVAFEGDEIERVYQQLRVGGQADVIAYTEDGGLLKILGKAYIRMMSWFSYAY